MFMVLLSSVFCFRYFYFEVDIFKTTGGASGCTFTASRAFGVIYAREVVFNLYRSVFAGSHAFTATDAGVFASLARISAFIPIAAHNRCGSASRNHIYYVLRASCLADAATNADILIHVSNTVLNADSVMGAFFRAIAKTYAGKRASARTAADHCRRAAG